APAPEGAEPRLGGALRDRPYEVRLRRARERRQALDAPPLAVEPVRLVPRRQRPAVPLRHPPRARAPATPARAAPRTRPGAGVPFGITTTDESSSDSAIRRSSRASAAAPPCSERRRAPGAGLGSAQAARTCSSRALRSAFRSTRATIWSPSRKGSV